jgi:hypothetical protein
MVEMATVEMTVLTVMLDKREDPKKLAAGVNLMNCIHRPAFLL